MYPMHSKPSINLTFKFRYSRLMGMIFMMIFFSIWKENHASFMLNWGYFLHNITYPDINFHTNLVWDIGPYGQLQMLTTSSIYKEAAYKLIDMAYVLWRFVSSWLMDSKDCLGHMIISNVSITALKNESITRIWQQNKSCIFNGWWLSVLAIILGQNTL